MTIHADARTAPSGAGLYKSAVVLASLGTDLAARVLSHLDDSAVELLILEMMRLSPMRGEDCNLVLEEFYRRLDDAAEAMGGMEYVRQVAEQAMGPEKAGRMLSTLSSGEPEPPLATILQTTSPRSLAALVADEHPQMIALLIGQLSAEQAALLLAALPADAQGPVAARLAGMEAPAPIALQHLERCLLEKLRGEQSARHEQPGAGPRRVADILSKMRRSVAHSVLASLEEQSPTLAQKVNQYRFTFEHLVRLDSRSLQRILRDIDADTLRLAMKGIDEERQQLFYASMSERAAARLREELENTGPTRLGDVEAAQQAIVTVALSLQESGEVQFRLGGTEEDEEEIYI